MKQVLQHLDSGRTEVAEVPAPACGVGRLLIRSQASLVSLGTERMLVEFGKASLLGKARQQPQRVKEVLAKVRTDGLAPTLEAVRSKLAAPLPLGYSNAGIVVEIGDGVSSFEVGDYVVSNGPHAEVVSVPQNLCARIPSGPRSISFEEAAFTVPAAIGLQGLRLAGPTLGEVLVVVGLGLIGQLTLQLLRANGCQVLGIDPDVAKSKLAQELGALTVDLAAGEDPVEVASQLTRGRGVDGVIITAATRSSAPVQQAALMCRKRGRVVLVGVTGLELDRAAFYEKELTFQVSCSYGPGRYDPVYEEKGHDYPLGFVRWTVARNFEAVLEMMAAGRLDVARLITHRFPIEEAGGAYGMVTGDSGALGVLLSYPPPTETRVLERRVTFASATSRKGRSSPVVGLIGAGNFTARILAPAIARTGVELRTVISQGGASARAVGRRFNFAAAGSDPSDVFSDSEVDTVFITTRHDSHARLVLKALSAGKNVFVEKPLAIHRSELAAIENDYHKRLEGGDAPLLGIGFNRRFAPHCQKMKQLLDAVREPKTLVMTVNAGAIPAAEWLHDPEIGGGRILGEACHFVDLLRYLTGAPITRVKAMKIAAGSSEIVADKATLTLGFADGSIGTVHYFANGSKSYPKEKLEVFAGGGVLALSNFRTLQGYGWRGFRRMRLRSQDKGHKACVAAFVEAVRQGGAAPIPAAEIFEVSNAMFDIVDDLASA